jgi:DNA-directed RNA polymerase subunit RPC12/RpoP
MEPVYFGRTEAGEPIASFSHDQFRRIIEGYACPRCWQEFNMILVKCPVCQLDLIKARDTMVQPLPEGWAPGPDDDLTLRNE